MHTNIYNLSVDEVRMAIEEYVERHYGAIGAKVIDHKLAYKHEPGWFYDGATVQLTKGKKNGFKRRFI